MLVEAAASTTGSKRQWPVAGLIDRPGLQKQTPVSQCPDRDETRASSLQVSSAPGLQTALASPLLPPSETDRLQGIRPMPPIHRPFRQYMWPRSPSFEVGGEKPQAVPQLKPSAEHAVSAIAELGQQSVAPVPSLHATALVLLLQGNRPWPEVH